jgi:phospholipid/cholesterol/gamma-HCH transport system substrate-binding protein
VITAKLSQLEALFADAPELISRVITLTDEVTKLFNDDNRAAIGETLDNLRTLSGTLAGSSIRIAELIDDTSAMAAELRIAAKDVRGIAEDARGGLNRIEKSALGLMSTADTTLRTADAEIAGVGGEARKMLSEFDTTAQSLGQTSEELRALISENRKPLRDFSADGLYDLTRMIAEMRGLVSSLSRIAEQLETDPSLYLFGGSEKGFEAK